MDDSITAGDSNSTSRVIVVGIAVLWQGDLDLVLWIKKARKYSITHLYKAIHKT